MPWLQTTTRYASVELGIISRLGAAFRCYIPLAESGKSFEGACKAREGAGVDIDA